MIGCGTIMLYLYCINCIINQAESCFRGAQMKFFQENLTIVILFDEGHKT